jgi:hypothetical protein
MPIHPLRRYLVFGPLIAGCFADAAPAAAKDTGVCALLTRTEAGQLLGAKVVKAEKKTSKINDAQEARTRRTRPRSSSRSAA